MACIGELAEDFNCFGGPLRIAVHKDIVEHEWQADSTASISSHQCQTQADEDRFARPATQVLEH